MGELIDRDQEHLRLLTWGYYITAGMTGFLSLFALLYIVLGSVFASGIVPTQQNSQADPRILGMILLGIGVLSSRSLPDAISEIGATAHSVWLWRAWAAFRFLGVRQLASAPSPY